MLELGRYVNIYEFKSIDGLRVGEYFTAAQNKYGCPAVRLDTLSKKINSVRANDNFQFKEIENTIYIPLIGNSEVVCSIDNLKSKHQYYCQIEIDTTKSNAQFVAKYLNSDLGIKIREWNKNGVIPKLNKQTICSLPIFIPPMAKQHSILNVDAHISSNQNTLQTLQDELKEIKDNLWKNPNAEKEIFDRVSSLSNKINQDMRQEAVFSFEQWYEMLPFPLASILRSWQATQNSDYKTKHEHLLHFFEAAAEFTSTILLSAFKTNNNIFNEHRKKLNKCLQKQHLSFERATFGTWKVVTEYLGKQTRLLLNDAKNNPENLVCQTMFSDESLQLPTILSSKTITEIFSATNKMRNDWHGHGGVLGQEEAKKRNDQLFSQLVSLRNAVGNVWRDFKLINGLI